MGFVEEDGRGRAYHGPGHRGVRHVYEVRRPLHRPEHRGSGGRLCPLLRPLQALVIILISVRRGRCVRDPHRKNDLVAEALPLRHEQVGQRVARPPDGFTGQLRDREVLHC